MKQREETLNGLIEEHEQKQQQQDGPTTDPVENVNTKKTCQDLQVEIFTLQQRQKSLQKLLTDKLREGDDAPDESKEGTESPGGERKRRKREERRRTKELQFQVLLQQQLLHDLQQQMQKNVVEISSFTKKCHPGCPVGAGLEIKHQDQDEYDEYDELEHHYRTEDEKECGLKGSTGKLQEHLRHMIDDMNNHVMPNTDHIHKTPIFYAPETAEELKVANDSDEHKDEEREVKDESNDKPTTNTNTSNDEKKEVAREAEQRLEWRIDAKKKQTKKMKKEALSLLKTAIRYKADMCILRVCSPIR